MLGPDRSVGAGCRTVREGHKGAVLQAGRVLDPSVDIGSRGAVDTQRTGGEAKSRQYGACENQRGSVR